MEREILNDENIAARGRLSDALAAPFPAAEVKTVRGSFNQQKQAYEEFSYVDAASVIRRLNAVTSGCWDFSIQSYVIEDHGLVARCIGTLYIVGLGSRSDIGTGVIRPPEQRTRSDGSTFWVPNEETYKGAVSDCLKRCARQFGVALDLYGPQPDAAPVGGQVDSLPAGVQRGVQNLPAQAPAAAPAQGGLAAQVQAPRGEGAAPRGGDQQQSSGGSNGPLTEPQTRKIWAVCNNLGINIQGNEFCDAVAIRFNEVYWDLQTGKEAMTKGSARILIDMLEKQPQNLMPVPGSIPTKTMKGEVAKYWIDRLQHTDLSGATEIVGVISAFYSGVEAPWGTELRDAAVAAGVEMTVAA